MQLKKLGCKCRQFRIDNNITVKDIAEFCNYSIWNIYKFEQGNVDSAYILLAYMHFGLQLDKETICRVLMNY